MNCSKAVKSVFVRELLAGRGLGDAKNRSLFGTGTPSLTVTRMLEGLRVTMNNAFLMGMLNGMADLQQKGRAAGARKDGFSSQEFCQAHTADQFP